MAAVNVKLTRGNTTTINNTAITDGQILYNTQTRTQYLDDGTTRLQIGQNIIVDATLNSSSNNPIANSGVAGVMHTSLSEISTITQAGNLPDALAVKELNSNIELITAEIGDLSHIFSSTYNDIAKLLQYYIDTGYLPDVNAVALIPILLATNSNILANGDNVGYPAWYSFDNSDSTMFITNNVGDYIGYAFTNPVLVNKITWKGGNSNYKGFSNSAKLQASSDNSVWIDIQNISGGATYNVLETRSIAGSIKYKYWRVIDSGARYGLASLQFYGN